MKKALFLCAFAAIAFVACKSNTQPAVEETTGVMTEEIVAPACTQDSTACCDSTAAACCKEGQPCCKCTKDGKKCECKDCT